MGHNTQLVEHHTTNPQVIGLIPGLGSYVIFLLGEQGWGECAKNLQKNPLTAPPPNSVSRREVASYLGKNNLVQVMTSRNMARIRGCTFKCEILLKWC